MHYALHHIQKYVVIHYIINHFDFDFILILFLKKKLKCK